MTTNQKHLVRFFVLFVLGFTFLAGTIITSERNAPVKAVFTGSEHHRISTEKAMRYIANFQAATNEPFAAGYMGRGIFDEILSQKDVVGIRIYSARLDNGTPTYVLVGVDANGNDLVDGVIGEDAIPCPPVCADGAMRLWPDPGVVAFR
ncbi:MAG: hypothetical protein HBSIN02_06550 [Bacteroidia bacterium]|nr:MAG: hypothetical protein HBSIN02_06550 [Bacteroidia bacterium]